MVAYPRIFAEEVRKYSVHEPRAVAVGLDCELQNCRFKLLVRDAVKQPSEQIEDLMVWTLTVELHIGRDTTEIFHLNRSKRKHFLAQLTFGKKRNGCTCTLTGLWSDLGNGSYLIDIVRMAESRPTDRHFCDHRQTPCPLVPGTGCCFMPKLTHPCFVTLGLRGQLGGGGGGGGGVLNDNDDALIWNVQW